MSIIIGKNRWHFLYSTITEVDYSEGAHKKNSWEMVYETVKCILLVVLPQMFDGPPAQFVCHLPLPAEHPKTKPNKDYIFFKCTEHIWTR